MSEKRMTEILETTRTTNKDGVLASDYATDYIFRGKTFSAQQIIPIAGSTTLSYVYDCSLANYVVTLPPVFSATGGPVKVRIYAGTDYVGVDSLNIQNRDASSAVTNLCTLKDQATGSDKGTETTGILIPSAHKEGGSDKSDLPFLPNGYKYLIELINEDTVAVDVGIKFVWFED